MPHKSLLPEDVSQYVNEVASAETDVMKRLRARTASLPNAGMQVSIDQGRVLALLARLTNARLAIEVGTFTGYSALCVASVLPADGKLICCDVSDEWTSIGKPFWQEAGVAGKIDLRIAPALQTLDKLIPEYAGKVDFIFIDADKSAYPDYYERALTLLRPGGAVAMDNMLRHGEVAREPRSKDTETLRQLTIRVRDDSRVDAALLTVGDGFVVACKR